MYYKADADRLREAVPKPLEVDDGSVFAYVTEIVSWSPNAPDLNVECPDLVQYGEAAFFVRVRYRGRTYSYCPYMWVDNDLPLLRGLLAGWPKKYAKVAVTRLHPMMEGLDRPRKGLRLGGYASRAGYLLYRVKVSVESEEPVGEVPLVTTEPFILPRYFAGVLPGLGAVNELVELAGECKAEAWVGKGEIDVAGGYNDELDMFKPVSEVRGYYFSLLIKPLGLRPVGAVEGF